MPSETDLLNDSLGQIGAARITAIDDGSANANYCQTFYPGLRDGMIRTHHWNFAIVRVELAQDATAPAFGWAYSYTLPADSLKVIEYNGSSLSTPNPDLPRILALFKIEGRKLVTNDGQVWIAYLARKTNPDEWDPLFYQACATWLASKLADAIPKDSKKSLELLEKVLGPGLRGGGLLSLAMAVDGQEGSVEPFVVDDLIWGR